MRIITDTSAMYTPEEAKAHDIDLLPLSVTINGKTYKEYVDIMPEAFIEEIKKGGMPSSSQPPIGKTMETFEKYPDEEMIVLNMADGLSGTYASTLAAKNSMDHADAIHVINTMTLCGPHRYLVDLAIQMRDAGASTQEIINDIHKHIADTKSFLIPADFEFLKKGGRLSPMAAKVGGMLKIVPVLELSEDGKTLEKFAIKKTEKGALKTVIKFFSERGVDERYKIYITHAGDLEKAKRYEALLREAFPKTEMEIIELSPVFITHGGPGAIAIQMIVK